MKKILKIFSIIAVIILSSIFKVDVYASKYEGVIYQGEAIDGIYFYKHREDTADTKYEMHNFNEQAHIYRRSTDNQFVYCIESWAPMTGAKEGDFNEESTYSKLSASTLEKIKLIAYYGYGYKDANYDHTNQKWYAITQYMIWQIQAPHIEHYFVSSISSRTPIYPYNNEIKEIENLVSSHNITPSFSGATYNLFANDVITLNDTNNVLRDKYQLYTYSNNIQVTKSGNSLTIKALREGDGYVILRKQSARATQGFRFYVSETYQDCMLLGNLDYINVAIGININSSSFKVNKYGEKLKSIKINKDDNLKFEYEYGPIKDIKFLLYAGEDIFSNSGSIIYEKDELVGEYITDDNGIISGSLPLGSYYLIEEDNNIYLSNKDKISFTLDKNNNTYEIDVYNKLPELKLKFNKLGEKILVRNNKLGYEYINLENSLFGLYSDEDIIDEDGKLLIKKDKLITTIETDNKGVGELTLKIPYGKYYLKEIKTDTQYVLDNTKYKFTFEYQDKDVIDITFFEPIINYLKKGNLTIKKIDNITGFALKGVKFNIYDEDKNIIYTLDTDEEGLINITLPYGKYYLQEVSTLDGYVLNEELILVDIDDENTDVIIEIENEKESIINVDVPATDRDTLKYFYFIFANMLSILSIFVGVKV